MRRGCRLRDVSIGTMTAATGECVSVVVFRMFATSFVYLMTSSLLRHDVEGISLAPVSWNMSNPIFKTSKNDHVIEVKLYDDIDFVCPFYPSEEHHQQHQRRRHHHHVTNTSSPMLAESHQAEYYVVYMVTRSEYGDCTIYDESSAVMMLNCSNPQQRKRFTILFEPFQSIPNAPEYHLGGTYYFITTSTGSRHGLGNLYQGACANRNMKLTVRVCCHSSTAATKTKSLLPPAETKTKHNFHRNNPQQYSSPLADSLTLQYRPPTVATPVESLYNADNARASHTARQVAPTRSAAHPGVTHQVRHRTMRPLPVKTSTHGKMPPAEDLNDTSKRVEDILSVEQAGFNTNTAHPSRQNNLCLLPIVELLFALYIRFAR